MEFQRTHIRAAITPRKDNTVIFLCYQATCRTSSEPGGNHRHFPQRRDRTHDCRSSVLCPSLRPTSLKQSRKHARPCGLFCQLSTRASYSSEHCKPSGLSYNEPMCQQHDMDYGTNSKMGSHIHPFIGPVLCPKYQQNG